MKSPASSDIFIRKFKNNWNCTTDYLIDLRAKLCINTEYSMPEDYIAATLLEEIRRCVNESSLENVVLQGVNHCNWNPVCNTCGRPVYGGEK